MEILIYVIIISCPVHSSSIYSLPKSLVSKLQRGLKSVMESLQILALGKNVHCVEVMSIDRVCVCVCFNYTISLLTCYDWSETWEPSIWKASYIWQIQLETVSWVISIRFLWGTIMMVVDFPQIYRRLSFQFYLPIFRLG